MLLSIMGFIGLGAEFVLRPAGGGDDRSERWRSRRDSLIIKPCHMESRCVVKVLVVDEFSRHMRRWRKVAGGGAHNTENWICLRGPGG